MPTLASTPISPPASWEEFEEITLSAAKLRWKSPDFYRNGRAGQPHGQHGVDIYGTAGSAGLIGIQCKHARAGLSRHVVVDAIRKADSFTPPLSMLYIATSAPTDGRLQEQVRAISARRQAAGLHGVDLLFWSDIAADLARDPEVLFKHYPYLRPAGPQSLPPPSGTPVFSADDLAIRRHPALGGKSVSIRTLEKTGLYCGVPGVLGLLCLNLWTPPSLPAWLGTMAVLAFAMAALGVASTLKKRRFVHFLFRRLYLEANDGDRIFVHGISATCPWCGSHMPLWNVGSGDEAKSDLFVCERVPGLHTIRLDPSCLPGFGAAGGIGY